MCLRFWKLRAGGANKKRKIYYCRTMNSNVEVIGDMEPETALVFSAKAEGGYQPYVWEYTSDRVSPSGCAMITLPS